MLRHPLRPARAKISRSPGLAAEDPDGLPGYERDRLRATAERPRCRHPASGRRDPDRRFPAASWPSNRNNRRPASRKRGEFHDRSSERCSDVRRCGGRSGSAASAVPRRCHSAQSSGSACHRQPAALRARLPVEYRQAQSGSGPDFQDILPPTGPVLQKAFGRHHSAIAATARAAGSSVARTAPLGRAAMPGWRRSGWSRSPRSPPEPLTFPAPTGFPGCLGPTALAPPSNEIARPEACPGGIEADSGDDSGPQRGGVRHGVQRNEPSTAAEAGDH